MYKDIKEFTQSKTFRGVLIGVAAAIVVLLIFHAGVFVGYRKASFAFRFGDNYYRAFGHEGPRGNIMRRAGEPFPGGLIEGHGAAGKIVSINLPTFVVSGPDEVEKIVLVGDDTRIRRFDTELMSQELKIDDFTVVLGSPNEASQIEAKLIRILPVPPGMDTRNGN